MTKKVQATIKNGEVKQTPDGENERRRANSKIEGACFLQSRNRDETERKTKKQRELESESGFTCRFQNGFLK